MSTSRPTRTNINKDREAYKNHQQHTHFASNKDRDSRQSYKKYTNTDRIQAYEKGSQASNQLIQEGAGPDVRKVKITHHSGAHDKSTANLERDVSGEKSHLKPILISKDHHSSRNAEGGGAGDSHKHTPSYYERDPGHKNSASYRFKTKERAAKESVGGGASHSRYNHKNHDSHSPDAVSRDSHYRSRRMDHKRLLNDQNDDSPIKIKVTANLRKMVKTNNNTGSNVNNLGSNGMNNGKNVSLGGGNHHKESKTIHAESGAAGANARPINVTKKGILNDHLSSFDESPIAAINHHSSTRNYQKATPISLMSHNNASKNQRKAPNALEQPQSSLNFKDSFGLKQGSRNPRDSMNSNFNSALRRSEDSTTPKRNLYLKYSNHKGGIANNAPVSSREVESVNNLSSNNQLEKYSSRVIDITHSRRCTASPILPTEPSQQLVSPLLAEKRDGASPIFRERKNEQNKILKGRLEASPLVGQEERDRASPAAYLLQNQVQAKGGGGKAKDVGSGGHHHSQHVEVRRTASPLVTESRKGYGASPIAVNQHKKSDNRVMSPSPMYQSRTAKMVNPADHGAQKVIEQQSSLWEKFNGMDDDLKPHLKESIKNLGVTMTSVSHFLLDLFSELSNSSLKDQVTSRQDKLKKLMGLVSTACKLFKMEVSDVFDQNRDLWKRDPRISQQFLKMKERLGADLNVTKPSYPRFKNELMDISLISDPHLQFLSYKKSAEKQALLRNRGRVSVSPGAVSGLQDTFDERIRDSKGLGLNMNVREASAPKSDISRAYGSRREARGVKEVPGGQTLAVKSKTLQEARFSPTPETEERRVIRGAKAGHEFSNRRRTSSREINKRPDRQKEVSGYRHNPGAHRPSRKEHEGYISPNPTTLNMMNRSNEKFLRTLSSPAVKTQFNQKPSTQQLQQDLGGRNTHKGHRTIGEGTIKLRNDYSPSPEIFKTKERKERAKQQVTPTSHSERSHSKPRIPPSPLTPNDDYSGQKFHVEELDSKMSPSKRNHNHLSGRSVSNNNRNNRENRDPLTTQGGVIAKQRHSPMGSKSRSSLGSRRSPRYSIASPRAGATRQGPSGYPQKEVVSREVKERVLKKKRRRKRDKKNSDSYDSSHRSARSIKSRSKSRSKLSKRRRGKQEASSRRSIPGRSQAADYQSEMERRRGRDSGGGHVGGSNYFEEIKLGSLSLGQFFRNFKLNETEVEMIGTKLTLDHNGGHLYLTGPQKTRTMVVKQRYDKFGLKPIYQTDIPGSYICTSNSGRLIIQNPEKNDLLLLDQELNVKKRLSGKTKEGETASRKSKIKNMEYSLNDSHILWWRGVDSLVVVDRSTFTVVNSIKDFFTYKSRITTPITACANQDATSIIAISQHPSNRRHIIHYYESRDGIERIRAKYVDKIFHEMREATTLEISNEGDIAYLAGINRYDGKPLVISIEMNKSMNLISYIILDELDYEKPKIMKRIKGHEILLVACKHSYCVLQFKKFKFYTLAFLKDIHSSTRIQDFEYKSGVLYSVGEGSPKVKSLKFGYVPEAQSKASTSRLRVAHDPEGRNYDRKEAKVSRNRREGGFGGDIGRDEDRLSRDENSPRSVTRYSESSQEDQRSQSRPRNRQQRYPKHEKDQISSMSNQPEFTKKDRSRKQIRKDEPVNDEDDNLVGSSHEYNSKIDKNSSIGSTRGLTLSNPKNLQINVHGLKNLEKIAISYDGKRIYVGGKGLYIIQKNLEKARDEGYSIISKKSLKSLKFFSIKCTNSKHLVIQEKGSNDLIILDKFGNEVTRLPGTEYCKFDSTIARNSHFTEEGDIMIWFSGLNSLSLVDMTNLSASLIPTFLPKESSTYSNNSSTKTVALRCVSRENGARLVVLFEVEGVYKIVYHIPEVDSIVKNLDEVLPNFGKVSSMELSYHQDVIYLGGSTSVEQGPHSSGIISACVFERNMPILAQKVFRKDDLRDCFSIKRLPRSDVIAVGGFQHLYLVQYSKKKFTSLFAFNNLHTGYISDICVNRNAIFTICSDDEFIASTSFNEEL